LTFIIKPIDCGNLARLVIAADESDAIWVTDFQTEEEQEGFQRVEATVYKIA